MAGRIRDADVALVRERNPVAEVVGATVSLRAAGGGRLKGLCPFHEEKSPSFSVNPSLGVYHCFGCGASGDVITFVRQTEALSFAEAVESLARRAGITLTYEQGGAAPGRTAGTRERLLAAHRAAAELYATALRQDGEGAALARRFLLDRGFDEASWERFGVGYAPRGWDTLTRHLLAAGFRTEELTLGGLSREGQRGPVDRFRGRLVWPIRDRAGEVIGFGARRLDDPAAPDPGPKYLNTPETPLYRKSSVLYGLDLARREIALRRQAVVVEGYTDVMACHLAGVTTAVATCGTSFGVEHIGVLRLLLTDEDAFRGEVVFTFDGDSAGQKAALRTFTEDQRFVGQTFVAVSPDSMDPCELRLAKGDAALRELVASRQPLFAFVVRSTLSGFDLDTAEGRVAALRAAAPVVAEIRDRALRPEYTRQLAGWLGLDPDLVRRAVAEAARRPAPPRGRARPAAPAPSRPGAAPAPASGAASVPGTVPVPGTASFPGTAPGAASSVPGDSLVATVEREALKLAVQHPELALPLLAGMDDAVFTVPAYRSLAALLRAHGSPAPGAQLAWLADLRAAAPQTALEGLLAALAVEPLPLGGQAPGRYATAVLARVEELAVGRRLAETKSRLERSAEQPELAVALLTELERLERYRQELRLRALGSN